MTMRRRTSELGIEFIKGYERFVPHVYDDLRPPLRGQYSEWRGEPVAGTLTVGYGHTDAAKHPLKLERGLRLTREQAREILAADLGEVEAHVNRAVKVPLTQGQFDALVSLSFNLGPLDSKAPTLLARLNRGDYAGARGAFDLYVRSKGKVLRGLQRRRDGEQALWDARYDEVVLPHEPVHHTANVDVPQPQSMLTSKEGNTILGLGGADTLHTISEASYSVAELKRNAEDAGLFESAAAILQNPKVLVGIAALIALGCVWYWRYQRRQQEVA